ncbi:hypothetical protein PFNF54_03543 [Plasmodium falciparum NF54]|nr:hypothetical protein PFNF54_03543 [Plasmodium falciparum NF54]
MTSCSPENTKMAPKTRASDYKDAQDAKHLLDMIGEVVQKQAYSEALTRGRSALQGRLSDARFLHGTSWEQANQNVCSLKHTHDTNVRWGVIHPCDNRLGNLYSEESASQCSTSRISGNNSDSGSCAPYRKLQLCDYNLEKITDANVTNTHNLLVDVLLAAKHEGDSLSKYMKENPKIIPKSNVCTVLARSFADIGDIIRGKDLYVGNRKEKEKEKLQKNLKNIFAKIHSGLTKKGAEARYKDNDENYYQLREDWWEANRAKVWEAMTCSVEDAYYFRQTCGGEKTASTNKCRCVNTDPPTYFDYVPQYLRWFEEWAEEFCRIKELKLENVKTRCRGEKDGEKYCSRNGYDCTGTIIKRNIFRPDPECTNCLFECNHYQDWIDNKKKEFEKQKKKCEKEIYNTSTTNKRTNNNVNVMYYDDFYKELQGRYRTINELLNSLNEETKCKSTENTDKESKIDFNDSEKTFSASKYCKPCPDCGVVKQDDGNFKVREETDAECQVKNDATPLDGVKPTDIEVLYSGVERKHISEKLSEFCSKPDDQYGIKNEKWECYYKSSVDNKCIMQTNNQKVESHSKIMKFYEFFIFWVTYMLNDCIDWKKKITKCINNGTKWRCKNKCKNNCKCFEKWVKKKQVEWNTMKEQYEKQPDLVNNRHFTTLEWFLEGQFLKTIEKAYGNEDAIEKIQEFLQKKSKQEDDEIKDKRDIIDILLEHELDEAQECKDNNREEKNCSKEPHDDLDDEDDLYEDETHYNPCSAQPGGRYTVRVKDIAKQMHRRAKTQMRNNSVVDDDNKLEGDIFKVTFRNGGKGSELQGENICNINTTHSNDSRGSKGEPCKGKDGSGERMKIGTEWSYIKEKEISYKDFYLPPRRQHMCTSNLENLDVESVTKEDKASHSLLGDVQLAAKYEAENIKKLYVENNDRKDQEAICRAVRYSFADIGDIIRGRDMWEHKDQTTLQNHLKSVFKNIKEKLPGIQGKYADDERNIPAYKLLREDWWEANRRQVWKAMTCENNGIKCDAHNAKHPPPDDYIPQRLRWMTEWSEWYCKMQSQEYEKLKEGCKKCMENKGKNCIKDTPECNDCKQACEEYNKKIKEWEKQWHKIQVQYLMLYYEANTTARYGIHAYAYAVGEKDKPVVAFLQKLQEANKSSASKRSKRSTDGTTTDTLTPTTPYSTAEGYVHQEATMNCDTQTQFCEKKHGGTTPTGTNDTDAPYTFKQPPPEYKDACECDGKSPQAPKKEEEKKDACTIVNSLLQNKKATDPIDGCNQKSDANWDCDPSTFVNDNNNGACMPPRRIKLCIYYLENHTQKGNIKKEFQLREAFIKCAGAEIFLLWQKYKTDNNSDTKLQTQLESGQIPEEFKRQMFYTFGDFRDLCLGNDIGKADNTKDISTTVNRILSVTNGETQTTAENWWEKNAESIWQGMLCGLSHAVSARDKETVQKTLTNNPSYKYDLVKFSGSDNPPTLEKFAQTPQFLRWFIEWSDEFCRERKEKLDKLLKECKEYECNEENMDEKKKKCEDACKVYEEWLQGWKDQYKKQSKKFTTDKEKKEYKDDPDLDGATYAYQYLSKKLKPICQNGTTTDKCDYNCMENASRQPQTSACSQEQQQQGNTSSTQNHFPEAFDCPPKEIGDRCNCPKLPEPKYCVDKTAYDIRKDAEKNIKDIYSSIKGNGEIYKGKCNPTETKIDENGINTCEFKKRYPNANNLLDTSCDNKGNERFKIGQKWNYKYIYKIGKNLYIPPRRQHMCINHLKQIIKYTDTDSTTLLKKVQEVAKKEGDDIIKKLLPKYPCNEDVICKAMKYSFADLGDIIRGRDIYIGNNNQIENKLQQVFKNIYDSNKHKLSNYNDNGDSKYTKLREAWWDANRKDIWKAMTCAAPEEAKIYITKEGGYISPLTSTKNHCGHKDDPPDYDYIPQPLRWISEWGEQFCLYQKHLLESMKICENCKKNSGECKQSVHGACMDCKKKCEEYKKFIEIWKKQFETQNEAYKEIYKKATSNGRYFNGIDENTKKFVKKLKDTCKTGDLASADKYLENGSVCRRFKFVKTDTHIKNYAFHNTPLSYKEHCECAKNFDPLDECPVDKDECKKYGRYSCRKNHYNKNPIEWTNHFVKKSIRNYEAVMVPPRRRQLCLIGNRRFVGRVKDEKMFKEYLLRDASSEAKMLSQYYNFDNEKALQAIKYSFADIGNIIKGDDMLDDGISEKIENIFEHKINKRTHSSSLSSSSSSGPNITPSTWWEKNKEKIWYVMMCYYTGEHKTATSCPSHNDIDNEDQFLRWMTEWAEYFCKEKKKEVEELIEKCKTEITTKTYPTSNQNKQSSCYKVLEKYNHWLYNRKLEWNDISKKYQTYYNENSKSTQLKRSAQEYVDQRCKECTCNFDEIIEKYDKSGNGISIVHSLLKDLNPGRTCGPDTSHKSDTKPPLPPPLPPAVDPPQAEEPFNRDILEKTIPFGVALALGSIAFLFLKK